MKDMLLPPLPLHIATAVKNDHSVAAVMTPFRMPFEATFLREFPAAPGAAPGSEIAWIDTTWEEVVCSALAVGRPLDLRHLATYGAAARAEVNLRLAALFAVLQPACRRTAAGRWVRTLGPTGLAGTLDETEKAAFSYRLGMALADWYAVAAHGYDDSRHLGHAAPGGPVATFVPAGQARPDLVLQDPGSGTELVVEAKGSVGADLSKPRGQGAKQLFGHGGVAPPFGRVLIAAGVGTGRNSFLRVLIDSDTALTPLPPAPPTPGGLASAFWRRLLPYRILLGRHRTIDAALGSRNSQVRVIVGNGGRPVVVRRFSSFGLHLGMTYAAVRMVEAQWPYVPDRIQDVAALGDEGLPVRSLDNAERVDEVFVDRFGIAVIRDEERQTSN